MREATDARASWYESTKLVPGQLVRGLADAKDLWCERQPVRGPAAAKACLCEEGLVRGTAGTRASWDKGQLVRNHAGARNAWCEGQLVRKLVGARAQLISCYALRQTCIHTVIVRIINNPPIRLSDTFLSLVHSLMSIIF